MICILTEKPSAARNFAEALGGMSGTYNGQQYKIVNSVGHIMRIPTDVSSLVPELKHDKYYNWDLKNLPWNENDIGWKRVLDPAKKDVYIKIRDVVKTSDEIVIATDDDPSGEGTLLADEILLTMNLKGKKISRMFFEDETPKIIQKAFVSRKSIPDITKDPDYIKSDYRSRWDYLSMQFTRIATGTLRQGSGQYAVLRNGRLKSFMVSYVGDGLKAVSEYKKIPFYQDAFKDENENWFVKKDNQTYDKPEKVSLSGLHPSDVKLLKTERKKSSPPKLMDLAALASALAPKGIKSKDVLATYQKMYEEKIVSYPRTEDKEITPEQFAEYDRVAIESLAKIVGINPGCLTHMTARPSHVKTGGSHGANRPTASNIPASLTAVAGKFGNTGSEIYKLLTLNFLCMYGEDYEYDQKTACVADFPEYVSTVKIPVKAGYKAIYDFDEEKPAKDFGKRAVPEIKEGFPKAPPAPTLKWLMKGLEKYNVGTGATRTSVFAEVTDKNGKFPLMIEEKGKLTLTQYGNWDYILLKDTYIGGPMLTERLQEEMKEIAKGKNFDIRGNLNKMEEYVKHDLEKMKENSKELEGAKLEIKELGTCPKCGKPVITGKFGPYCSGKCGITFSYFGKKLTDANVKTLLAGKEVLLKNQTSKAGNKFDIYIKMDGLTEYNKADGSSGYCIKFATRFPERKGATKK